MYLKLLVNVTKMTKSIIFLTSLIVFIFIQCVSSVSSNDILSQDLRIKLKDEPKCPRIRKLCPDYTDDIEVLECLQEFNFDETRSLGKECQQIIWNHTETIVMDDKNVQKILQEACGSKIENLKCDVTGASGNYLACILDKRDDVKNNECLNEIQRLEIIAFFNLKWLAQFLQICKKDLEEHKCNVENNKEFFLKRKSLACLQENVNNLEPKCKANVFKLTEFQSDNLFMNPELQSACKADRLKFCRSSSPASEDILKCLTQYRGNTLSKECDIQLLNYQKLVAQDFKVSKEMMKACREDIRKYHCRKQISEDRTIRLTQILLCLENYVRNGSKISSTCEAELIDQRKMLMEDFRLSPEIVDSCKNDIEKFCKKTITGRTIHCLMEHATSRKKTMKIQDTCRRALEELIKDTDAGEDWRVDPVLQEACQSVKNKVCRELHGGDARVMSCLVDNLGTDYMTEDCENALLQIQYFVARDFRLDPQLYRSCHEDAVRNCHAKKTWSNDNMYNDPENAPLILPCLYRYAYHEDKDRRLKHECLEQIRRVMRQRAISVDLQPEIEEQCLDDLSLYCFKKVNKGEEIMCLQQHLNDLKEKCKIAVHNFTEEQAQHVELNPVIMNHCSTFIDRHCKRKKDEGDVMECLIMHKNDPDVKSDVKCRAAIEHFQLISLKSYHFTYKFKLACKPHVIRFCQEAKTKADVISCLSEIVRNDTLLGYRNRITKECRQQMRSQLFQQRESINLDVKLKDACRADIEKFCVNIVPGSAKVLECLKTTEHKLTMGCQKQLFKIRLQDMKDNSIDYTLVTMCQDSIRKFCENKESSDILECLKNNKEELDFDKKCKHVVIHRLMEQNRDYRFNPKLQLGCSEDINKFCLHVLNNQPELELEGKVIECLKAQFRKSNLRSSCQTEITTLLRDQALNYQLNPYLKMVCSKEIDTYCYQNKEIDESTGQTEECLKNTFLEKKAMSHECKKEVVLLIEESEADIHVDPMLQKACTIDLLRYCSNVQQGRGKLLNCLQITMNELKKPLQPECKNMLSKRIEMYRNANLESKSPEDLHQLYSQIVSSPAKRYFMIVFITAIGIIFFAGLFCGKITRRKIMKNK